MNLTERDRHLLWLTTLAAVATFTVLAITTIEAVR